MSFFSICDIFARKSNEKSEFAQTCRVADKNVVNINGSEQICPGPRIVDGLEQLAQMIQPELFPASPEQAREGVAYLGYKSGAPIIPVAIENTPGYPTLMVAVQHWLETNPDWCPLAVLDRETIVAATKFVLCRRDMFKRYEARMLEVFKDNVWPLGADFEPHWCLVLGLDTRLAAII